MKRIVELKDGAAVGIGFRKIGSGAGMFADSVEVGAEAVKAEPGGFVGRLAGSGENVGMGNAEDGNGVSGGGVGDEDEQPVEAGKTPAIRKLGVGFRGEERQGIAGKRAEGLDATVGLDRNRGEASMRSRVPAPAGDECGKDGGESKRGKEVVDPSGCGGAPGLRRSIVVVGLGAARRPTRPEEVLPELDEKAEGDQRAGDVGSHPAWVLDDLKDGSAVVVGETGLVNGASGNAERMVHVYEDRARVARGIAKCEAAGEAARNVGAAVTLVDELIQGEAERVLNAPGPELELPGGGMRRRVPVGGSIPPGDGLSLIELERGKPIAKRLAGCAVEELEFDGGQVAAVEAGFGRPGLRGELAGGSAGVGRRVLSGDEGSVGVPVGDAKVERNSVGAEGAVGLQAGAGDGDGFPAVGEKDEFYFPGALGPVTGLAGVEGQAGFGRDEVGGELAEDEKEQTEVNEVDAELCPRPAKARDMGGEEVDDEDCTKQMATGKDGNRDAADVGPDEEAAEVAVLREVEAVGDLPDRPGKNKDHR